MSSFTKLAHGQPSGRLSEQSIAFLGQGGSNARWANPNANIKFEEHDDSLYEESAPQATRSHIPRPRNAFFVFRSFYVNNMRNNGTELPQSELSKNAAMVRKTMRDEDKLPFFEQALAEKDLHSEAYPDYHYTPARKGGNGTAKSNKPTGSVQMNAPAGLPFHRDFVPTSDIPEFELSPRDKLPQTFGPPTHHHKHNTNDPTLPPLPRSSRYNYSVPYPLNSSLLYNNPYPSAHYLANASSSTESQRGNPPQGY